MGDCGQRAMAEQLHPCSDYRPQTGQVETLEAISNQRVGTHQSEGLGGPFEEEMGGTPSGTLNSGTTTLEFSAWQRIRKHPVPLICPKYSFAGHGWWQPLLTWTRLSKHPSFEESDYLIPTISKDGMGFIARPGQADRTLRWLKDALGRRGGSLFQDLTWHSFRVFIPDCAFQLGISRELDDRINSRCLHQGKAQCGGQGMAWSGQQSLGDLHGRTDGPWRPQSPWLGGFALGRTIPIKEEREGLTLQQSSRHLRINHRLCWRRTNQERFRKCLHYRRKWTARYQVRHQRTNWAILMAPFGWWHHPENQAQRAPIRSTCSRWTIRQWDVDGSPPH